MMRQHIYTKKIKFFLVFFCVLCLCNCSENCKNEIVTINYKDDKAVGISFQSNKAIDDFEVFIKGNLTTPVLGAFEYTDKTVVFTPVIPFSKGQHYEIRTSNTILTEFTVKEGIANPPKLITVYPTRDTVPENLLKMYFIFSKPMQEVGSMIDYVKVYNTTDSKEEAIFLALENELWNKEHTQLTLWLDPGRIKRDLIPNREKGLPIVKGKEYTISIDSNLKDADGNAFANPYSKRFYIGARDSNKPSVDNWSLTIPTAGTKDALQIDFKEPLDAILLQETITIATSQGTLIDGDVELAAHEQRLLFYPAAAWKKNAYTIRIESHLEDLAGNNLNHLFDRDVTPSSSVENAEFYELEFRID